MNTYEPDAASLPADAARMRDGAAEAAASLRSLAHEGRLLILCCLVEGEHSVTALTERLGVRQASVSQQLARLRAEGRVTARRDGQRMIYALADDRLARLIGLLHELYCTDAESKG